MKTGSVASRGFSQNGCPAIHRVAGRIADEVIRVLDPGLSVYNPGGIHLKNDTINGGGLYGIESKTSRKLSGPECIDLYVPESAENLGKDKLFSSIFLEIARQGPHIARRKYSEKASGWENFNYERSPSTVLEREREEARKRGADYSILQGYTRAVVPITDGKTLVLEYPESARVLMLDWGLGSGVELLEKAEKDLGDMAIARDMHTRENYSFGGYFLGLSMDPDEREHITDLLDSSIESVREYIESIKWAEPRPVFHVDTAYGRGISKIEGNQELDHIDRLWEKLLRQTAARQGVEAAIREGLSPDETPKEFYAYCIERGPISLVREKIISSI